MGAALPTRPLGRGQEATQTFGRVVAVSAEVLRLASSSFLDLRKDVVNRRLEARRVVIHGSAAYRTVGVGTVGVLAASTEVQRQIATRDIGGCHGVFGFKVYRVWSRMPAPRLVACRGLVKVELEEKGVQSRQEGEARSRGNSLYAEVGETVEMCRWSL